MEYKTTKGDVATLLENFASYVNPDGDEDPWFTLEEINQQFAWEDIPDGELTGWLDEMIQENLIESKEAGGMKEYRWLS